MLRLMHATYPCSREIAALTNAIGKVKYTINRYRLMPTTARKSRHWLQILTNWSGSKMQEVQTGIECFVASAHEK
ncbi:hypothetical protein ALC62_07515 [Cyphomyrmex costatus]|uniref:Uncharacterized protein n=1 Tax=Cyphomyrmex costatus TaxID=456900 RepID=A0A151IHK9_9HYME|nr:hypothetical protein ALC62_07515 [Cyphomyrmex costatus]